MLFIHNFIDERVNMVGSVNQFIIPLSVYAFITSQIVPFHDDDNNIDYAKIKYRSRIF